MGARSSKNTTQNNRSDGHLLEYFRKSFIRGGGANAGPNIPPPPPLIAATGGDINGLEPGNNYAYHTFTSTVGPSTFIIESISPQHPGFIDVLVVAGGGGGGKTAVPVGNGSGGGGAGGVVRHATYNVSSGPYPLTIPVSVGGGGAGGISSPNIGQNGSDSTFGGLTAKGGGGGGYFGIAGSPGGSGGGGGGY